MLIQSKSTDNLHCQSIFNEFTLKIKGQNMILEHFCWAYLTKYKSLQCRCDNIKRILQFMEGIEGPKLRRALRANLIDSFWGVRLGDPELLYKY